MTSLLDIGPLTEEVEIRGTKIVVQGLTAGHLFQLFSEFPEMRKLLQAGDGNPQDILLQLAPDLIARIIAIATGSSGDKKVEAKAKTMGAAEQLLILSAAQRLSFPGGIGPFIEQVNGMMGSTLPPMQTILQETASRGSLKSTTRLPAQSNASLQTDTPGMLHGAARRVN